MIVKVYDDEGHLIREGPARQDEPTPQKEPRIFGFRLPEFWLFVTFIFGVGLNWAAFNELRTSNAYLVGFAKNSDAYHSAVLGTAFEQGKPADAGYDVGRVRNAFPTPMPSLD